MSTDLIEIDQRLAYCESELETIKVATKAYIDQALQGRQVQTAGGLEIHVRISGPVPVPISGRVGTTIHEIRSCLDSLACRLAERNGQDTKQVYFPISKDESVFAVDGMRKIKKLSAADQQTIINLEPHGDCNPILFGMHEFDRERKHNRLGISGAQSSFGISSGQITAMRVMQLEPLTEQWQPFVYVGHGTTLNCSLIGHVMFLEPDQLRNQEIVGGISGFLQKAREIVGLFR